MADTITSSETLAMGYERSDESIQYIKMQNPKTNLNSDTVITAMKYLTDNNILLDSKDGTVLSSTSVFTAYTEEKSITSYDLS